MFDSNLNVGLNFSAGYRGSSYSQTDYSSQNNLLEALLFLSNKSSTSSEFDDQELYFDFDYSSSSTEISDDSEYSFNDWNMQGNSFNPYGYEDDGLSFFNPRPLADPLGNQIPFNNASILDGLFGNVHGVTSIISRYAADTMPTDKDAPGYTWKYTVPGQNQVPYPTTNRNPFDSPFGNWNTGNSFNPYGNEDDGLSFFNPRPLADPLGNQIPFNNASILDGLFGNVHGVTSIISRYAADTMPTDKDAPGYTWKYTVPGQNQYRY